MRQVTLIGLIVLFYATIVRVQEWLTDNGSALDMTSFLAGIGVTVLFGLIWFKINHWYGTLSSMSKPQSVSMQTQQTPARVTIGSIAAFFKLIVFLSLMVLLAAVLLQDEFGDLLRQLSEVSLR